MNSDSDIEFIKQLFETHEQPMFKIAVKILNNKSDAEDALQDAFLWIIDNVEKIYSLSYNEQVFYFTCIIEHSAIDLLRKKKRRLAKDIDKLEICGSYSIEDDVLNKITVEEIEDVLDELSERERSLLHFQLFKEMSCEEIGNILGLSETNVRVSIHRAKKRLRKILKKRGFCNDI